MLSSFKTNDVKRYWRRWYNLDFLEYDPTEIKCKNYFHTKLNHHREHRNSPREGILWGAGRGGVYRNSWDIKINQTERKTDKNAFVVCATFIE